MHSKQIRNNFGNICFSKKTMENQIPNRVISDAYNEQTISNLFSKYFQSVFLPETHNFYSSYLLSNQLEIHYLQLTESEVEEGLQELDSNKAARFDKKPSLFLENCVNFLVKPLTLIFNKALHEGGFPNH